MHLLACCNGEYARDTTLATALQQQSCDTMLRGFSWPPSPLPLPEGGMSQSLPIGGDDSFGNLNGRPYEQHVRYPHIPTRTSLRHRLFRLVQWSSSYAFWMGNWGKSFGNAGATEGHTHKNAG